MRCDVMCPSKCGTVYCLFNCLLFTYQYCRYPLSSTTFLISISGGEERWDSIYSAHTQPNQPFVVLNNAYSTSYDLGNKRNYEEAYYLKRVSKGWIFRVFPGPWEAYMERPDGSVELLETYKEKPPLNKVATFVREESFRRYAINNDRYAKGFGGRL